MFGSEKRKREVERQIKHEVDVEREHFVKLWRDQWEATKEQEFTTCRGCGCLVCKCAAIKGPERIEKRIEWVYPEGLYAVPYERTTPVITRDHYCKACAPKPKKAKSKTKAKAKRKAKRKQDMALVKWR